MPLGIPSETKLMDFILFLNRIPWQNALYFNFNFQRTQLKPISMMNNEKNFYYVI